MLNDNISLLHLHYNLHEYSYKFSMLTREEFNLFNFEFLSSVINRSINSVRVYKSLKLSFKYWN
ncbi:MAG: hypothetical protein ACI8UG_000528 [Gammaproteobacteria bacterium]|jgi:hypothetical protein